ncbi:MAG: tetratricopeptide repeat protein [Chloroflexi bacterium]|nr:tetratricopeptide repeat protein [Chloroflexota bacterium]
MDPLESAARVAQARDANRARFARLVARPEADIDLAEGALLIAADGRAELDPAPTFASLDTLAELVRLRIDVGDPPDLVIARLHHVLYIEAGFHGPTPARSADPELSRLDRVVDRRRGLPISLAIVELEVASRIGLRLTGVGLPGHFLVGGPDGQLMDPADGGRLLSRDDCQALLRRAVGEGVLLHAGMLRPVGRRQILARVLRNLRAAHLARRDWPSAYGAVSLLAVLEPTDPDHGRDRGLLLGRMGRFTSAIELLAQSLEERPDSADAQDVRQVMSIFSGRRN